MAQERKLSKSMSEADFINGYWYAADIKAFARSIGISPVTNLRKDELELLILEFLRTGTVKSPPRRTRGASKNKDCEKGLSRELPIVRYTNNSETKEFLNSEAIKLDPAFKPKSGAMYRLNRWREQQMEDGRRVTYGDLVDTYVELCRTQGPFPQAPSGRYINFLSDYLKGESEATRRQAIKAWEELKKLPIPKDYRSWRESQRSERGEKSH
ncbi:MAG: hypothetical protein MPN21_21260 [Thermoanaerobaculia bacterium]|nr:hypothetical protein [Thermoanaerobaculia bacterium]